jgi:hypothetical protein
LHRADAEHSAESHRAEAGDDVNGDQPSTAAVLASQCHATSEHREPGRAAQAGTEQQGE